MRSPDQASFPCLPRPRCPQSFFLAFWQLCWEVLRCGRPCLLPCPPAILCAFMLVGALRTWPLGLGVLVYWFCLILSSDSTYAAFYFFSCPLHSYRDLLRSGLVFTCPVSQCARVSPCVSSRLLKSFSSSCQLLFQFYSFCSAKVCNFHFYFLECIRHHNYFGVCVATWWMHPSCFLDFDHNVLCGAWSVLTERQKSCMMIVKGRRGLGWCDFSTENMGVYF